MSYLEAVWGVCQILMVLIGVVVAGVFLFEALVWVYQLNDILCLVLSAILLVLGMALFVWWMGNP